MPQHTAKHSNPSKRIHKQSKTATPKPLDVSQTFRSNDPSLDLTPENILRMQHIHGNTYVNRLIQHTKAKQADTASNRESSVVTSQTGTLNAISNAPLSIQRIKDKDLTITYRNRSKVDIGETEDGSFYWRTHYEKSPNGFWQKLEEDSNIPGVAFFHHHNQMYAFHTDDEYIAPCDEVGGSGWAYEYKGDWYYKSKEGWTEAFDENGVLFTANDTPNGKHKYYYEDSGEWDEIDESWKQPGPNPEPVAEAFYAIYSEFFSVSLGGFDRASIKDEKSAKVETKDRKKLEDRYKGDERNLKLSSVKKDGQEIQKEIGEVEENTKKDDPADVKAVNHFDKVMGVYEKFAGIAIKRGIPSWALVAKKFSKLITLSDQLKHLETAKDSDDAKTSEVANYAYGKNWRAFSTTLVSVAISILNAILRLITIVSLGASAIVTESAILINKFVKFCMGGYKIFRGVWKWFAGTRGIGRADNAEQLVEQALSSDGDEYEDAITLIYNLDPFDDPKAKRAKLPRPTDEDDFKDTLDDDYDDDEIVELKKRLANKFKST